jgi:Signal transduction histidine kinase
MDNAKNYHMILHEIKNSVAFVSSSLQLVQKKHPEICSYDFWDESVQELSHLQQLLADLSLNHPFDVLCPEPVNLSAVLSSASAPFHSVSAGRGLQIIICPADDIDIIMADPLRLKLVLSNLIKNACEAMHGSGTVTITANRKDQDLILTVADNGPGIAKENIKKIFEPFFTTKPNGTGLGLEIALQIVEGHGGTLSVFSNGPDGCTFRIVLPAAIQK